MNSAIDLLMDRRSIRSYLSKPIEPVILQAILNAGIAAPSAHDSRPWHFVVVTTVTAKVSLCETLSRRFSEDLYAANISPEEVSQRIERSQRIFKQAAAIVVAFGRKTPPYNSLAKSSEIEQLMISQSVALACGQILLSAHFLGIGGCWFAAPLFCPQAVCDTCKIDSQLWGPQALITLGYPAVPPKAKPPLAVEDYITYQ